MKDRVKDGVKDRVRDGVKDRVRDGVKDGWKDRVKDIVKDRVRDGVKDGWKDRAETESLRCGRPCAATRLVVSKFQILFYLLVIFLFLPLYPALSPHDPC